MSKKVVAKEKEEVGILLPKSGKDGTPYLSYSQISTWKKSKRDYMRQYFHGEKFEGNAYTDFGSAVGEALETGKMNGFTAAEKKFLKTIPRHDEFERKITLKCNGFDVIGYIDSNTKVEQHSSGTGEIVRKILDYKTGEVHKKTEEYQSDDYFQLDIYAAALQQELGHLPEVVEVIIIHRNGNAFQGEDLTLGDHFGKVTKEVTQERVESVIADIEMVAKEISDAYKVYLKLIGLM